MSRSCFRHRRFRGETPTPTAGSPLDLPGNVPFAANSVAGQQHGKAKLTISRTGHPEAILLTNQRDGK
jgi:hypothetical protein